VPLPRLNRSRSGGRRCLPFQEGITVVLVTHDAGVANYAKRTIHIKDGLIVDGVYNPNAVHEAAHEAYNEGAEDFASQGQMISHPGGRADGGGG
jgi:ABC-type phosphate/phosphonate transport system ATPase subunit